KSTIDIGTVPPGQTRQVTLPCIARTSGKHKCDVTAEGDGLKAFGAATVRVLQPKFDLEVAGPKMRYIDRKAAFTVKLTNPGDAPAAGVSVCEQVPEGFKFVAADSGGKYDPATRKITWAVGELGVGKTCELKFELTAIGLGDFTHKVVAGGSGAQT